MLYIKGPKKVINEILLDISYEIQLILCNTCFLEFFFIIPFFSTKMDI